MTDTTPSSIPSDRRYTKDHEWARRVGDVVEVGITSHAVAQLGDITMVTLPEAGTRLSAGESFGDVDSVKAVSELYAPVDGEVVERNAALDDAPETVNAEPYEGGWLVKIRLSDPAQFDALLEPAAYGSLLAELG